MGDERMRKRRVTKEAGHTMLVRWCWDEREEGWFWRSQRAEFSFNDYVFEGDLVRYREGKKGPVRVAQVQAFTTDSSSGAELEPAVSLVDLESGAEVVVDIEAVRPLHANWWGDRDDALELDGRVAGLVATFELEFHPGLSPVEERELLKQRIVACLAAEG